MAGPKSRINIDTDIILHENMLKRDIEYRTNIVQFI